jgi:hypothetical protein
MDKTGGLHILRNQELLFDNRRSMPKASTLHTMTMWLKEKQSEEEKGFAETD